MASPTVSSPPRTYYEPQARHLHCSNIVGGKLYTHGGHYGTAGTPSHPPTAVEVFDLSTQRWEQQQTFGKPHPGFIAASSATIGTNIYYYGGNNTKTFFNSIHCLDTLTLRWNEVVPSNPRESPIPKHGAAMFSYLGKRLVMFGGYGLVPVGPITAGVYVPDPKHESDNKRGWTSELHYFDVDHRTWTSPLTTGSPPPACNSCSLTRVDENRAVLFGGMQLARLIDNHVYILELQSWTWITVRALPGQPWPVHRQDHSAVSLHDADSQPSDPALMMMWGTGGGDVTLSDAWNFSVNTRQWKQVILPDSLRGRAQHTTSAVYRDPTHKQLVTHGGYHEWPKDNQPDSIVPVTATTIVELEHMASRDWVVTDIIRSSQIGQSMETVIHRKLTTETPLNMKLLQCLCEGVDKRPINIISKVAPKWLEFATHLQLKPDTIEQILSTYPNNPEASCTTVFLLWLNGQSAKPATLGSLMEFLRSSSIHHTAREIEHQIQLGMTSSPTPQTEVPCPSPAFPAEQKAKKLKQELDAHRMLLIDRSERMKQLKQELAEKDQLTQQMLTEREQTHTQALAQKELQISSQQSTIDAQLQHCSKVEQALQEKYEENQRQAQELAQKTREVVSQQATIGAQLQDRSRLEQALQEKCEENQRQAQQLAKKTREVVLQQATIDVQFQNRSRLDKAIRGKEQEIQTLKTTLQQKDRELSSQQLTIETHTQSQIATSEELTKTQEALTRSRREVVTLKHTISSQEEQIKSQQSFLHQSDLSMKELGQSILSLRHAVEGKPQVEELPKEEVEVEKVQLKATRPQQQDVASSREQAARSDHIASHQASLRKIQSTLEVNMQEMTEQVECSTQTNAVLQEQLSLTERRLQEAEMKYHLSSGEVDSTRELLMEKQDEINQLEQMLMEKKQQAIQTHRELKSASVQTTGQLQGTPDTGEATLTSKGTQEQLTPPEMKEQGQLQSPQADEEATLTVRETQEQLSQPEKKGHGVQATGEATTMTKDSEIEEQPSPPEKRDKGPHPATQATGEATTTTKEIQEQLPPPEKRDQSVQTYTEPPFLQTSEVHQLRGVHVVGETTFTATRHSSTLKWEEYGFALHIPEGALPPDVQQCHIHVKATIRGQFQLPDDHELVSAVFWIWCRHKLSKPATMEIEHCAAITTDKQCSALTFVRTHCTQENLPYTFKPVSKGVSTPDYNYGTIFLSQFSAYGVSQTRKRPSEEHATATKRVKHDSTEAALLGETVQPVHISEEATPFHTEQTSPTQIVPYHLPQSVSPSPIHSFPTVTPTETAQIETDITQAVAGESIHYCAQLYCANKETNTWLLYFVLMRDLRAEMQDVMAHFSEKASLEIESIKLTLEEDQITLDIPEEGIHIQEGWKITPCYCPTIMKEDISRFRSGSSLAECELLAEWEHEQRPRRLKHKTKIVGARPPRNFFLLTVSPALETGRQSLSPHDVGTSTDVHHPVFAFALDASNVCDILQECRFSFADWDLLAHRLCTDIDVKSLRQTQYNHERCLYEAICQWLHKDQEASWGKLADAVGRIGEYGHVVTKRILKKVGSN